ncbi:ribosomal subunit 39S-domain-containing protein [Phialemonium atrogriseum]|uniref:Large ribosomal subunit protein mL50 n=1 Tax=Phialemonium atrogriseum TaxID=1093897 RepID=A0AAJ0FMF2_9PEZI|nr:ribosomal subunit 39S-domain-containing protein [Phialemonium atrogriseum]KAK1767774.1 ribosomal subunit 39S-domain-containing protein [Phialemonium atrogriseum]
MRRLTRLRQPSSIISTCSSSSRFPVSVPAAATCSQRRDLSCAGRQPPVSHSTSLSSRIPLATRAFSTAPVVRHKHHEDTDLEAFEADPERIEIHTDLNIPSEIRKVPLPEEITEPGYTPAETLEGLEWVGGVSNWWEDERNWPASKNYVGFGRSDKVVDPAALEVLTRRAVVEALAVRKGAGDEALSASWQAGGHDQLVAALGVGVEVSVDGSAELTGDFMGVVEGLTARAEEQDVGGADWSLAPEEAREFLKSWDRSWKQISLQDLRLKFAVTKRIQQLTGHVIPDSKLIHIRTVSSLIGALIKPPKPKKLAQLIEAKGAMAELRNVKVYPRRVTPIDKEKMVGRWKVMVRELEKRNLPVTGTGGYGKSVEKRWATGKP